MPDAPRLTFAFPARYEVAVLDRIERSPELRRVLAFPRGESVHPHQELSAGVILAVRPERGEPWIGIFEPGGYGAPPAAPRQVLGWPDECSICVVLGGAAYVVRTDDPSIETPIDLWPVCGVLAVPSHDLVVFADFTNLAAYGRDGLNWESARLAWDDVKLIEITGDRIRASGYDAPAGSDVQFTVDLRTGKSADSPYSE